MTKNSSKKILAILFTVLVTVFTLLLLGIFKPQSPREPTNEASRLCNEITIPDIKYSCLALVNHQESFCNNLDSVEKNICLAAVKGDSSYCQNLTQNQRGNCYQNLVDATTNIAFCDELDSKEDISSCHLHFVNSNFLASKNQLLDISQCEQLLPDTPEKHFCLAMVTQDKSYCNDAQNECFIIINKDPSDCLKSASELDKSECFHTLAMLTKASNLCSNIIDEQNRDICFQDYGRISVDKSVCNNINNKQAREICYKNVAINLNSTNK